MVAYDYIRRTYGVNPVPGERIRHGSREGVIVLPRSAEHYVHVRFDGAKDTARVHPTDGVEYLGPARILEELTRLIELIEAKLADVGEPPTDWGTQWPHPYHLGSQEFIDELVTNEGAVYQANNAEARRLKLAGVRTSCTGSQWGLLRNWIAAADRRRVELRNGGAA